MERIKDFRRKQGNLEFFFLSIVRADSKEMINFLINYGRTLQLGGKDYAGVNEIDLDAEIACNADRLEVIRQFAKDGLKSPKPINVFKLPKIKKMMDIGVVNGREVSLLQVICDSLISIMENNKTLFKSIIKKYTKQDETDSGGEPQQYTEGLKELFNEHVMFIGKLQGMKETDMVKQVIKWSGMHTEGKPICKANRQSDYARELVRNGIVKVKDDDEAGTIEKLRRRFSYYENLELNKKKGG